MDKATRKNPPAFSTPEDELDADSNELLGYSFPANRSKKKLYLAKEIIYREGSDVDKLYYIRSGMVKSLSYLPNGRARIVSLYARGHWLGLEGLASRPYAHTTVAVGDVEVDYFSLKNIQQLDLDNSLQYLQLLKQAYGQLAQADRWIAEFSSGGIRSRVARLLEFLSTLEYGEASGMVELLTVHEMADILGVTPESVSRILAEFKRNKTLHKLENHTDKAYQMDFRQLRNEALQ